VAHLRYLRLPVWKGSRRGIVFWPDIMLASSFARFVTFSGFGTYCGAGRAAGRSECDEAVATRVSGRKDREKEAMVENMCGKNRNRCAICSRPVGRGPPPTCRGSIKLAGAGRARFPLCPGIAERTLFVTCQGHYRRHRLIVIAAAIRPCCRYVVWTRCDTRLAVYYGVESIVRMQRKSSGRWNYSKGI
jgi:hypothetical protein